MKYNNSLRSIILPLIIALSISAGLLFGRLMPGSNSSHPPMTVKPRNNKIGNILSIVEAKYVDSVDRESIVEDAIPYILNNLDPHSVYIPARDLQRMNEPLQGNFEGIGVSFNMLTDTVLIISTIPGGPSEKVGVMPGDKIIYVGDSLVAGQGVPDQGVISLLKGPRGTEVTIRVLRKGENDLLPFTIKRDKIPIYSVDVSYMVNPNTGYIKISRFSMTTYQEFIDGLQKLKNLGMERLILDLRGNVGGVMDPATQIADEFLEEGKLIVYTEGRSSPRDDVYASATGIPYDSKSSYMRGASHAPDRIRDCMYSHSTNLFAENGLSVQNDRIKDEGNIKIIDYFDISGSIENLLNENNRVVSLGGDHSITYPILKAYSKYFNNIEILHIDAHADLYDELDEDKYSHACPFARIMEESLAARLVQVGIRTLNDHQREQSKKFGTEILEMKDYVLKNIPSFKNPVYLSIDLDGLDPAFAPGVSHHEPGGLSSRDVINIINSLEVPVIGADIVELNPIRDNNGITTALAAKLTKEILAKMLETD